VSSHAGILRRLGARLACRGIPGEAIDLNGQSLELDLARAWPFSGAATPRRVDQFWRGLRADLDRDPVECGALRFYPSVHMDLWGLGPGLDLRDEAPPAAGAYAGLAHQRLGTDLRLAAQWLDDLRGDRLALAFRPVRRAVPAGSGGVDGHPPARRPGSRLDYFLALPRRLADPDAPAAEAFQALERLGLIRRLDWSVLWTLISLLEIDPARRVGCALSAATFRLDAYWRELSSYLGGRPSLAQRLSIELPGPRAHAQAGPADALARELEALGVSVLVRDAPDAGARGPGTAELLPAWCGPVPCLVSDRASEYGGV
jgi:hypothetical protein